jgi:hypothetical protein
MSFLPTPRTVVERLAGIIAMVGKRLNDWQFRAPAPDASAAAGRVERAELRTLIFRRFQRIGAAFAALLAQFRAGTLLPPRTPFTRRAGAGPRKVADPALADVPRCFGWLLEMAAGPHDIGADILPLLAEPEMQALAAAAPDQMRRIFRPVCWALAVHLPEALQAPRKPGVKPRPLPIRPSVRASMRAGHKVHLAWVKAEKARAEAGSPPPAPPRADESVDAWGRRPTPSFLPPLGLPNFRR